ncbi:xanthine dehydrogenase family protein molybdopterin-binding subunit [Pseudomonas syringae]|uniref:xanthine dehydrogenase family protein molybdopterin-binding subunit n=1 Tax=Pseudomonas syringae TaxID=317 RepID=UPI0006E5E071|nr:xanthine dehydrogenase family protein molybdopterin-binding subunit [Pseudomonas syringae]KPY48601.1 Xanthine dehydrogenase, molybdenum binding subunit [Pseudomonas syringae pv. rhaphiolepidis]KWS45273.1 aldehyde oxidase [Pseudomonas syringae pv. rhaphiolepidis]
MNQPFSPMGKPVDRVDGRLKVTGGARYAGEYPEEGLLYASVVSSTIANGRVVSIDTSEALKVAGVVAVIDHTNRPSVASYDENYEDADSADGSPFRPFYNDNVMYSGQPLALVVADTLELARHAGSLVRIEYEQQAHETDLQVMLDTAHDAPAELPPPRGNFEGELASSALSVDVTYSTPSEYHNPMEPHASTVLYQADGSLQIHDKTQGTQNCQDYLHKVFGLEKDKIRVLAAFVGGAFGSGLRPQYQLPLAVMAALHLKRSVRLTLTRQQMFTFGYRPRTVQRLRLGAAANGRLLAIDPVRLRLTNYAERNGNEDKPYSSKELRECYRQGAERFGWESRNPEPRSMRQGRQLVGWGMAGGVWEAMQMKASAKARLEADGSLVVSSATTDIGTGTYTVMTQIAAEASGIDVQNVTFLLGDSSLPTAPLQGGSFTVSSVGTAVQQACQALQRQVLEVAKGLHPQFASATPDEVRFEAGKLYVGEQALSMAELAASQASGAIEVQVDAEPDKKREAYAAATHSAVFVEVLVDEDLGTIKVNRVVSAVAAGRVVNPKMARSQILGGVVWGMGMALQEEAMLDHTLGRPMNHSLAEYHIPVNADIGDIDVLFVEEHDEIVNALGSKGVGEIGIVGVPAAIANAIYHATGKRIREFPITLDKLL